MTNCMVYLKIDRKILMAIVFKFQNYNNIMLMIVIYLTFYICSLLVDTYKNSLKINYYC